MQTALFSCGGTDTTYSGSLENDDEPEVYPGSTTVSNTQAQSGGSSVNASSK